MSFDSLNKDELAEVAEFFNKDILAEDDKKGPTKKELIDSITTDTDGVEPVTWDDYKDIYLKAKETGNDKSPEVKDDDKEAETAPVVEDVEEEDDSDYVLVKYERKNPSYEVGGVTFTTQHPFASVKPELADFLVRNIKGFRPAMSSEVTDYYN